jgi:hypothetical protein
MKLGLIGTGKQGQRYLMEKNGGRHIVRSGSRSIDYEGLDGVIIATHPAGHKQLALKAIERGLPVLVEKPLALNLRDCMDIIDAAEKAGLALVVAHTDCWAAPWISADGHGAETPNYYAVVEYFDHQRDYSVWLDWAPHGLALIEKAQGYCDARDVCLERGDRRNVRLFQPGGREVYERSPRGLAAWGAKSSGPDSPTPMWLMVRDFLYGRCDHNSTRRIYRALFAE